MKSLLVTVSLFLASLFPGPHASKPFPVMPAITPVATIAGNETPALPAHAVSTPALPSSPIETDINLPQRASPQPSTATNAYVTHGELAAVANTLRSLVYALAASSTRTAIPEYIAASGNPENPYAANSAIDQLNGTTLTNVTVNSVSGLTVADIPSLSGTYLPLAGGTLSGDLQLPNATSTTFYATTASSTNLFASIANLANATINSLTLTNPLTVANGGTGWNTINSGSLLFGNGSTALATSSSLFWDSINSRLGIGTTSPTASLELFGSNSSTNLVTGGGIFEAITNADQTAGNFDSLSYREVNSAGAEVTGTRISGVFNSHVAGAESADLAFITRSLGTLAERMRLTGAGNFGIGTSSPQSMLAVSGGTSIGADYNVAAPTNGLIVEGNVGIGTTTPLDALDVVNTSQAPIIRIATTQPTGSRFPSLFIDEYKNGFSGSGQLLFRNWGGSLSSPTALASGATLGQIGFTGYAGNANTGSTNTSAIITASTDEGFSSTNTGAHLAFFTTPLGGSSFGLGAAERMRITANGAVGINASAPAYQLDVRGFGRISTTTFTGVGLNDATAAGNWGSADTSTDTYTVVIQTSGTPDTFEWQKNGGSFTTAVSITGGNQTLTDGVQIKFAATTGHTVGDQWVITATPVTGPFGLQNAAGTRVFAVANNGEVGINTSAPLALLDVNGGTFSASSWTTNGISLAVVGGTFTDNSSAANSTITTRAANSFAASTFAFINGTSTITNAATLYVSGAPVAQASSTIITNALALDVNGGISYFGGNVGVGTMTPYAKLAVKGPDTASTSAFYVVNSASTTVFSVYDNGNATYSGSIFQSSDQRLKTNITSLGASSSLAALNELNPVSYNWIDPNQGSATQLGFIAQQVGSVFPNLVSTTSPTALTPDGTLTLNYSGLIAPIIAAVQELSNEFASFAQSITTQIITAVTGNFSVGNFSNELCVGSTCVTPAQFQAMVEAAGQSGPPASGSSSPAPSSDPVGVSSTNATDTPPVIKINGNNPAIIQVSSTYNDLGATIIGPQPDLNLGIKTYLNGALVSNIAIDTSEVATDTINYVATDVEGNKSTSTRTVIVQGPDNTASTTDPQ